MKIRTSTVAVQKRNIRYPGCTQGILSHMVVLVERHCENNYDNAVIWDFADFIINFLIKDCEFIMLVALQRNTNYEQC